MTLISLRSHNPPTLTEFIRGKSAGTYAPMPDKDKVRLPAIRNSQRSPAAPPKPPARPQIVKEIRSRSKEPPAWNSGFINHKLKDTKYDVMQDPHAVCYRAMIERQKRRTRSAAIRTATQGFGLINEKNENSKNSDFAHTSQLMSRTQSHFRRNSGDRNGYSMKTGYPVKTTYNQRSTSQPRPRRPPSAPKVGSAQRSPERQRSPQVASSKSQAKPKLTRLQQQAEKFKQIISHISASWDRSMVPKFHKEVWFTKYCKGGYSGHVLMQEAEALKNGTSLVQVAMSNIERRENIVGNLQRLAEMEAVGALPEKQVKDELIKILLRLRVATVESVEGINHWRQSLDPMPKELEGKYGQGAVWLDNDGQNYLVKMKNCFDTSWMADSSLEKFVDFSKTPDPFLIDPACTMQSGNESRMTPGGKVRKVKGTSKILLPKATGEMKKRIETAQMIMLNECFEETFSPRSPNRESPPQSPKTHAPAITPPPVLSPVIEKTEPKLSPVRQAEPEPKTPAESPRSRLENWELVAINADMSSAKDLLKGYSERLHEKVVKSFESIENVLAKSETCHGVDSVEWFWIGSKNQPVDAKSAKGLVVFEVIHAGLGAGFRCHLLHVSVPGDDFKETLDPALAAAEKYIFTNLPVKTIRCSQYYVDQPDDKSEDPNATKYNVYSDVESAFKNRLGWKWFQLNNSSDGRRAVVWNRPRYNEEPLFDPPLPAAQFGVNVVLATLVPIVNDGSDKGSSKGSSAGSAADTIENVRRSSIGNRVALGQLASQCKFKAASRPNSGVSSIHQLAGKFGKLDQSTWGSIMGFGQNKELPQVMEFITTACETNWDAAPWNANQYFKEETTLVNDNIENIASSCMKIQLEWDSCTSQGSKVRVPISGKCKHKEFDSDIYFLSTRDEEIFVAIAPLKSFKKGDFFTEYTKILQSATPSAPDQQEEILLPSFSVQRVDKTNQFKGLAKGAAGEEVVELCNVQVSAGRSTPGAFKQAASNNIVHEIQTPCVFAILHSQFEELAPLYLGIIQP